MNVVLDLIQLLYSVEVLHLILQKIKQKIIYKNRIKLSSIKLRYIFIALHGLFVG